MSASSLKNALYFLIFCIGYFLLGYVIDRHNTLPLLSVYFLLFVLYVFLIKNIELHLATKWVIASVMFRFMFILAEPTLSDDFYRFIWDGRLWNAGFHPFAALPSDYLLRSINGIDDALYQQLNSKTYFTIYPPVAQASFFLSTKFFPDSIFWSVVVMRLIIITSEAGSLILLNMLLIHFDINPKQIMIYALNPLVIIELTGNLHFEALIIFFTLLTVWFAIKGKAVVSSFAFAMAIGSKLLPLVFLPALVASKVMVRPIRFIMFLCVFLFLLFLPLLDITVMRSMLSSVSLYFNKFEFNASIYYLVREYGYWNYGYNIIQTVGWKLACITTILILLFTFRAYVNKKLIYINHNVFHELMWVLFIYFAFTTTLHPWYIATLLAFSLFTRYQFPMLWTALIFLSYSGYTQTGFHENLWLTTLQYLMLYIFVGYELYRFGLKKTLSKIWVRNY